jgi:hypothetical protein
MLAEQRPKQEATKRGGLDVKEMNFGTVKEMSWDQPP